MPTVLLYEIGWQLHLKGFHDIDAPYIVRDR